MLKTEHFVLNDVSTLADTVKRIALLDVGEITDDITRQAAISSIRAYQKHISPQKGFACAYRILYGSSCSENIKNIIEEVGLLDAIPLARQQFALCRDAKLIIQSNLLANQKKNDNCQDMFFCSLECCDIIGDFT